MYKKLVTYHLVLFSTLCVLLLFQANAFCADSSPQKSYSPAYRIQDVHSDITSDSITIRISGNSAPAYTAHEEFEPFRLILDVAGVKFAKKLNPTKLVPDNRFVKLSTTTIPEKDTSITKFVFQITKDYHSLVKREGNDIVIKVVPAPARARMSQKKAPSGSTSKMAASTTAKNPSNTGATASEKTLNQLIGSSEAALEKKQKSESSENLSGPMERAAQIADPFASAGFSGQRISVDFYKIDIHNIFRLFHQISGMNIVVDDAVKGSVTISLNNVPWDFALDVVCNLMELKKEKRFNTIIIYPKNKKISWPTSPLQSLSIKADKKVLQQEALVVQQELSQSKEVTQAKKLILQAQQQEKSENYERAAELYQQAFALWPKNVHLADKLTALYLVNLNMNARAVYYARKSLQLKPSNDSAALMAAIASANMHHIAEASEYFNQSVSGSPPLKEALISYAAFNENFGHLKAALKLLNKYNKFYGENLDTMLSKARIYDKIGNSAKATAEYRSILLSGFQMPPDLKHYIEGRLQASKF